MENVENELIRWDKVAWKIVQFFFQMWSGGNDVECKLFCDYIPYK